MYASGRGIDRPFLSVGYDLYYAGFQDCCDGKRYWLSKALNSL